MVSLGQPVYSIHYLAFHLSGASLKKPSLLKSKPKDCWVALREDAMRVQSLSSSLWCNLSIIHCYDKVEG